MSDNRRVYRTIRIALKQMDPTEPKGNVARMLTTLAALVSGIVLGKICQLPTIERKAPDQAKADSRIKRYSSWVQNERIDSESYYLPFVSELLVNLAQTRELVFIIDGSEIGHECITLMISLIYGKWALPITWLVVKGCKGHLPERLHLELLSQLQAILPKNCQVISSGMGSLMGSNSKQLCMCWVFAMFVGRPRIPNSMKTICSFRSGIWVCVLGIRSASQCLVHKGWLWTGDGDCPLGSRLL